MELDDGGVMLTPGEGKTVSFSGNRVRSIRGQPDGAYSVVEWVSEPGIRGTPRHIHMVTDEAFYVLEGTFGFRAGESSDRTLPPDRSRPERTFPQVAGAA